MILRPENVIKKVDDLGRITLPKSLRDRMYLNGKNNELEIFTMEVDGKMYICLSSPETDDNRLLAAAEVFDELGVELPLVLQERVDAIRARKN